MSQKVFITGLTGFAGRHLSLFLEREGFEIYGTSWPEKVEDKRIFWLDLRNGGKLNKILREVQPEWIFHLAAYSHVGESWRKPRQTISTNFLSTLNVLESALRLQKCPRVLFVSSAEVYGSVERNALPIKEICSLNPMNPYALSKLFGEMLANFYNHLGMEVLIVRPFNYTGPGQSNRFVCSDFAYQIAMIEKEKIEPQIRVGNLSMKRDFTDVRDVVKGFYLLMKKGERGEPYNICSGRSYSIEEILNVLLSFSVKEIEIIPDKKKFRRSDNPEIYGDFGRIGKLGWEPKIPIEETLKDILNWWRERV